MLDFGRFLKQNTDRLIRIFREQQDSAVVLLRRESGEDYVLRLYDHPVQGYEAAQELNLPELPRIYRFDTVDGCCLVEEEYVDGIHLSELLEVYRPDESQTAAIGEQLCRALQALHEKEIIHRDVKPENVLITSSGRVVLLDLDASSKYDPEKDQDTRLLGTAGYAAPEQFGFGRSDVRADLFSLGVLLNVMQTGQHPSRCLAKGSLRRIIEKCIEVNADKRYATAAELGHQLAKYAMSAQPCPVCGFTSPGGGCLCCRIPSGRKIKRHVLLPCLAVLAGLAICAGLLLLPGKNRNNGTNSLPSSMQQDQSLQQDAPSAPVQGTPPVIIQEDAVTTVPEVPNKPAEDPNLSETVESVQPEVPDTDAEPSEFVELSLDDDPNAPYDESNPFAGLQPKGSGKIIQTRFERYRGNIGYQNDDFVFQGLLPGEDPPALIPFSYDLDKDGTGEPYYFGVLQSNEEPPEFCLVSSIGSPYDASDRVYNTAAIAVFQRLADGSYVPVDAFAEILCEQKLTVHYIALEYGATGDTMPFIHETASLDGIWKNTVLIEFHIGCVGGWVIEGSAEIDGVHYTGYCLTELRSDWRGIEVG